MDSEDTIHKLRQLIRHNQEYQRELKEKGCVTLIEREGIKLQAARLPHSAEWTLELQNGPEFTSLRIRESPDTDDAALIQIVESQGGDVSVRRYQEGDINRLFGKAVCLELIHDKKTIPESEIASKAWQDQQAKIVDFALVSEDPFFLNRYEAYILQSTAQKLSARNHFLRYVKTFTSLEALACAESNADQYIAIIDAEIERHLFEVQETPGKLAYFRNYGRGAFISTGEV